MDRPAANVESSSKLAAFRLGISRFTAQTVLLVGSLHAMVEAAGIELQSEKARALSRVAPVVALETLG